MDTDSEYRVVVSEGGIACEHPICPREAIDWEAVNEISIVTTDEGPLTIDVWVLFVGETGGCSIPQEAAGFDDLFEVFKRFEGFDYQIFIEAMGSTENAKFVCGKN